MAFEYTDEEEKKLFQDVLDGKTHLFSLPVQLYTRIAEELTSTIYKSFNISQGVSLNNPDFDTPRMLKRNLYDFSAAKTFQQIKDMQNFIFNEKGFRRSFSEFEKYAKTIFDTYNRNWLEAEFETATNMADSAARWQEIQAEKDIFPLLKYNTLRDGSVREEHVSLDGIVKPVNDPFWNTYNPPNGWRCRCFVEQLEERDAEVTDTTGKDLIKPTKLFALNPGKDNVIFKMDGAGAHPYSEVKSRFRRHQENNFGLPLPPDVRDVKTPKPKVEVISKPTIEQRINTIKEEAQRLKAPTDELKTLQQKAIDIQKPLDKIDLQIKLARAGRDTLKEQELVNEWNEIIRQTRLIRAEIDEKRRAYGEQVLKILRQDTKANFKIDITKTAKIGNNNLTFAHKAFEEIVGKRTFLEGKTLKVYKTKTGRAFQKENTININSYESISTVTHEMAHWLEQEDFEYFNKVTAYYRKRTDGYELKRLKELKPNSNYEFWEVAKEDKFANPYTGKWYANRMGRQNATELTSMWFTGVFEDLDKFIKEDEDFFTTIFKLLNE